MADSDGGWPATKRCRRCGVEKPRDSFPRDRSRSDGLSSYCRACCRERDRPRYQESRSKAAARPAGADRTGRREYYQAWYRRNADLQKARVKARVAELQAWFRSYKRSLVCVVCGEEEPSCLEFHHLDPAAKEDTLSRVVAYRGWSVSRILDEASKCAVLCANCHRKVHAGVMVLPPV